MEFSVTLKEEFWHSKALVRDLEDKSTDIDEDLSLIWIQSHILTMRRIEKIWKRRKEEGRCIIVKT